MLKADVILKSSIRKMLYYVLQNLLREVNTKLGELL